MTQNKSEQLPSSGQTILFYPTNDLNHRISEVELKEMFTKLENNEQILKILQVPRGISRV